MFQLISITISTTNPQSLTKNLLKLLHERDEKSIGGLCALTLRNLQPPFHCI